MRITKLETKRDEFSGGNSYAEPPAHTLVAPAQVQRLPYQVVASCRCDAAPHIEALILLQLQDGFDQGYQLEIKARHRRQRSPIDFTVSLACSTEERAALVRLVTQLGMEAGVSSVLWQSRPVC